MTLIPITSLDLPQLQPYRTLRGNLFDKDNSFIADSPRVVLMLLKRGIRPKSLLATEAFYAENRATIVQYASDVPCYVGSKEILGQIVGRNVHHHVMMHAYRPESVPLEALGDRIVLTERLSNMENVGAIARSAAALGVDAYAVPSRSPHPYGRRAVRVSTGHVSRLQVHLYDEIVPTLEALKRRGYHIYAAEATLEALPLSSIRDVPQKWVLVVVNEEEGVLPETLSVCDEVVQIEMEPEIKSFNVAVATSIVLHWLRVG